MLSLCLRGLSVCNQKPLLAKSRRCFEVLGGLYLIHALWLTGSHLLFTGMNSWSCLGGVLRPGKACGLCCRPPSTLGDLPEAISGGFQLHQRGVLRRREACGGPAWLLIRTNIIAALSMGSTIPLELIPCWYQGPTVSVCPQRGGNLWKELYYKRYISSV